MYCTILSKYISKSLKKMDWISLLAYDYNNSNANCLVKLVFLILLVLQHNVTSDT